MRLLLAALSAGGWIAGAAGALVSAWAITQSLPIIVIAPVVGVTLAAFLIVAVAAVGRIMLDQSEHLRRIAARLDPPPAPDLEPWRRR